MEIETAEALAALLARHEPLRGVRLQNIDLTDFTEELLAREDLAGMAVLGGSVPPVLLQHLLTAGAVIFPSVPDVPVSVYRASLYTPEELYAGVDAGYDQTPDARAYAWFRDSRSAHDAMATMLRAIHDDAVVDALAELVHDRLLVGVMGGHGVRRGSQQYAEAAHLGQLVAGSGCTVVTGGGPGAMEAANLGARCGNASTLADALSTLTGSPDWTDSVGDWAQTGLAVARHLPRRDDLHSLGIPTWYYGHEPPNVFAQRHAKLFSNAIREDILLSSATGGVVVLPGAAGTVQEVFQAATRLYYLPHGRAGMPLVLVGRAQWTEVLPVWPLLQSLAAERRMAHLVHLVDSVDEAGDVLAAWRQETGAGGSRSASVAAS